MRERVARDQLYTLLERFQSGHLDAQAFCSTFERIYNLELDKAELSPQEAPAFSELFDKVVWFSPFAAERQGIPNYLGDEEIGQAVDAVVTRLQLANTE